MKREAQNCTFPLCVATEGTWLQVAAVLRAEEAGLGLQALTLCRAQGSALGLPSLVEAFLLPLLFCFNFLYFGAGIYLGWWRAGAKALILLS